MEAAVRERQPVDLEAELDAARLAGPAQLAEILAWPLPSEQRRTSSRSSSESAAAAAARSAPSRSRTRAARPRGTGRRCDAVGALEPQPGDAHLAAPPLAAGPRRRSAGVLVVGEQRVVAAQRLVRSSPSYSTRPSRSRTARSHRRSTAAASCETKTIVPPRLLELEDLAEALALKRLVADGEHLVEQQHVGLEVRRDGEAEPHVHAGRVRPHRQVDEPLELGERDDLVESLARRTRRLRPWIEPFR